MRISLLLQREPFGSVIEKTLSRFWSAEQGHPVAVHWRMGRGGGQTQATPHEQLWLVNIYLNALFTPDAEADVFDPIRREFARSTRWWRQPFQRVYVGLALAPRSAGYLAQARLSVSPPIPDARHKLVVAGNHKVRLLERHRGLAYGILKEGFRPDFMHGELAARRQAARLGLPVPALVDVAADRTWFSEQYVSGTPINRLRDKQMATAALKRVSTAMVSFITDTLRQEPLSEYLQALRWRAQTLVSATAPLQALQSEILALLDGLIERIDGEGRQMITTALTHGDFQPANILVNESGTWLIDWEYAARRQAGYDALVLALSARFPTGLAERLCDFVVNGTFPGPASWPGLRLERKEDRLFHARLFLVEELLLHLDENAQPPISKLGQGLLLVQSEIARWLEIEQQL